MARDFSADDICRVEGHQVEGVWLPKSDAHLPDMIRHHSKVGAVTLADGRAVGTYQLHKLRAALAHVPADRRNVALDIGAHVGLWSMHLVAEFAAVHAFEPIPLHRTLFRRNMGQLQGWSLRGEALGAAPGYLDLHWTAASSGDTHVAAPGEAVTDRVAVRRLDDFPFPTVDFVKIDVEGWEAEVVAGAEGTLRRCRPVVCIEQKGHEAKFHGRPRDEARARLEAIGMVPLAKPISGDWIYGFQPGFKRGDE